MRREGLHNTSSWYVAQPLFKHILQQSNTCTWAQSVREGPRLRVTFRWSSGGSWHRRCSRFLVYGHFGATRKHDQKLMLQKPMALIGVSRNSKVKKQKYKGLRFDLTVSLRCQAMVGHYSCLKMADTS